MFEWNGFDGGMSIWSMARVRTCTNTIKTQLTRPYTQTESQCTTFNTTLEFRCLCRTWLLPCTLGTVSIKLMTSSYMCMTYLVSFQFIDVNLICPSIRSVRSVNNRSTNSNIPIMADKYYGNGGGGSASSSSGSSNGSSWGSRGRSASCSSSRR